MRGCGAIVRGLAIALTLGLGLTVRFLGSHNGAPDRIFHPDVSKQAQVASCVRDGKLDWRGNFGNDYRLNCYPYGVAVLTGHAWRGAPAPPVGRSWKERHVHRWRWAVRLRQTCAVLFAISAVAVLWFMSSRVDAWMLILCGALLGFDPLNAEFCLYGMNDPPLVAMLLLAWLGSGALRMDRAGRPIFACLTGLLLGVAFGVKYQAVLGFIFPALALVLEYRRGMRWIVSAALGLVTGALAGVCLSCPPVVLWPVSFAEGIVDFMQWQSGILGAHAPLHVKLARNVLEMGALLWRSGAGLLLAALLAGLALRWRRYRSIPYHVGSGALFVVVLAATVISSRDIVRINDILPISSFAMVCACLLFGDRKAPIGRFAKPAAFVGGCAILFTWGWTSSLNSVAMAQPDTRELAREWCRANVPAGSRVVRERYTLSLDRDDVWAEDVRSFGRWHPAPPGSVEFEFLITSSFCYDRFLDRRSPLYDPDEEAVYGLIFSELEKVAEFTGRGLNFANPRVTVLRRRVTGQSSGIDGE